jgi:hypothetical protein
MKKVILTCVALALSGCGVNVEWQAANELARAGAEVAPNVSTRKAIQTFNTYCYQYRADPGRVVSALKSDGYQLVVTLKRKRTFVYAKAGEPAAVVVDMPSEPACAVMVKQNPKLAGAFDKFIKARHRNAEAVTINTLTSVRVVPGRRNMTFIRDIDDGDEMLMLIVK